MPELIEIEAYRRLAACTVGRRIRAVSSPDPWYLKGGLDGTQLRAAVRGTSVGDVRRIGKLLLLDLVDGEDGGPTLGLRFGMTGRLLVDGDAAIERLEYGSSRAVREWDRFGLRFTGGGSLVVRDPRRLGGISLEPDTSALGPDALDVDAARLAAVLGTSRAPLKARLMDQSRLAGLGNLLTDEILWRAGLAPARPAGTLSADERARLADAIRSTVAELGDRGGSHTGDLQPARQRGSTCPCCGHALAREAVAGRTTYWCPGHQA